MTWIYRFSENTPDGNYLYTVGFYDPEGKFHSESDGSKEECAARVHWLNGGNIKQEPIEIDALTKAAELLKSEGALKALHYYKTTTGCSLSQAKQILGI